MAKGDHCTTSNVLHGIGATMPEMLSNFWISLICDPCAASFAICKKWDKANGASLIAPFCCKHLDKEEIIVGWHP